MAKCAVDMFTKCMATELGPKGIRVNAINCGYIRTGILAAMGKPKESAEEIFKACAKLTMVGRIGVPEDVGDSILYLASDHAAFAFGTKECGPEGTPGGRTQPLRTPAIQSTQSTFGKKA
ncbi:unnamed protein product, partial [Oppiella nova]